MSLRKAPKLDGFKKQEYGLDIDKDSARYRESGNQNNLSHCSVTDGPRDNMPANIFNVSALFLTNILICNKIIF